MVPYGPLTADEARATYAEQAKALAEGGVDLLLIETMFALEEATPAFEGARSVSDLPIVVSFSYDRGVRTMMGVKTTQVMKTYTDLGAVAIGANCGTTLDNMEKVVGEYGAANAGFPLWIKPNAGLPHMDAESNRAIYDVTPEMMGERVKKFVAMGARIVGGCCGSTPEHVAAIARAVKGS
jgi:5-methyltetrahydrofolate--homocysteine methyltransferase